MTTLKVKNAINGAISSLDDLLIDLKLANSNAAESEPLASIILLDLIEQAVKIENKLVQIQKSIQ
jgi:hypothetical protein